MAFWGVEVKPGKPYIHIHDGSRGALRLSQATLGDGTATKRSVLQCNVGNKSPVLLCSLLPDRAESSCLDLQFEESEEVIFSVVGPRSVHLAGYFIGGSNRRSSGDADDSDSYGEDIGETGSEDYGSYGSEDEYESDFIDDGDIEVSLSHRLSGVVIEDEKPVKGNFSHRHVKKKHQVSDSDEGDVSPQHQFVKHSKSPALESEEEDGFPISFSMGKKNKEKKVGVDGKLDDKTLNVDRKRKLDVVVQDKGSKREDKVDAFGSEKSKKKKKDKVKSVKSVGTDANIPGEKIKDLPCQDQSKCADDKYEVQPCEEEIEKVNQEGLAQEMVMAESSRKLKKRKKERVRRGETHETGDLLTEDKVEDGATTAKIETTDNSEQVNIVDNDNDLLSKSGHRRVSDEMETSSSSDKWKRKKKKTKGVGTFDQEKRSAETLGKEGNDKGQSVEIIVTELSKSQEKMDHDRPVGGLSFKMTTDINGESVPADEHLKHNKKKHHKKSR